MSELPAVTLTKADKKLLSVVKKAVKYSKDGDPLKDFIDEDQVEDALDLLVRIAAQVKVS